MSDDRRKMNKQSTGTVPKIKCRNNTSYLNERESPRSCTNNLVIDFGRVNMSEYFRNSGRNLPPHPNYSTMNTSAVEEQRHLNPTVNGSMTPTTSSSTSRRNSSGTVPKCDNITKYPDKKQIEDKLCQIREYLQITTSLMSSMKNTDDQLNDAAERNNLAQMIKDLKDSEMKLVNILKNIDETEVDTNESGEKSQQVMVDGNDNYSEAAMSNSHRNELEEKVDHTNREMEMLRDQQMTLLTLQQKAENRLKDARQIQEKLMMSQYGNDLNSAMNQRDKNFTSVQDFDVAIKELEERTKRLNEPRGSNSNLQDKLLAEVDSLQNQIVNLHNVNEDRNQLIQVLDNRDTELRAQHIELQNKLTELQNKKMQIDQLVAQLQNMEDADDDDVGVQVRKIVTMKDQLSKLKDMLEIVKTTETVIQNSNGTQEEQELACDICTKAENFLQKDVEKRRTPIHVQHESNVPLRYDNTGTLNENRHKQINKNAISYDRQSGFGGAKPKSTSNSNKLALQVELEAKKRELEEIMGKHKAGTSNLNHDVGTDNKSEFSCSSNAFFDGGPSWAPIMSDHNRFDSSESDECPEDINEYSELNSHHNQPGFTLPVLNYPQAKPEKCRSEHSAGYIHMQENDRLSSIPRTPERNVRSNSVTASRERARSNSEQSNKSQVQKQLELIRSVCDSMLEQHQSPNIQQLRNNLTPSSLYSEPRRFTSPNPHSMNALVNPLVESPWAPSDPSNYQGWLATSTLQTQAFMLNTLNQCCQMLWLQQRELIALRQTVNQMQERMDGSHFENQSHLASPLQNPGEARSRSNQKINQVAAACSMPNLNQYNIPSVNLDPSYQNNMQNARLLDPCLNNANLNLNTMSSGEHINNSVLHAVNANINQMPSQMWNGQALNNQVAPGNRANNYWDNFRSYSRQNLLSTKSNEGFQNNVNPFALISLSKSNSDQTTSANASQENTPHRRSQFVRNSTNRNNSGVPPDVLNINHNVNKTNDLSVDLSANQRNPNENESNLCYHYLNNAFSYNEISSNNSNISEEHIFKECIPENAIRRNEWHEEQIEEQHPKSKLFEELRENVYKEVVTLISANETRPHFLIQLFRDLQMISSDPLRLKILQSIQTIITHSLISSNHVSRQVLEQQQNDQMIPDGGFSLQSTVWSKSLKNPAVTSRNTLHMENEAVEMQSVIKEIIPYLNDHEDDLMGHPFLVTLKQILIESESFKEAVRDSVFKKHFSNVLDEVLAQYHGKKVRDVKMHVIQTVNDLLRGELSFIQLIQETCPENCESNEVMFDSSPNPVINGQADNNGTQIQNGDLAEADQGRVEDDDVEEEGAVGGFWDLQLESPVVVNSEEVDLPAIEFQNNAEVCETDR
ncbi:SCP-1 and/or EzrA domain containing protein [Asbolus verrucosus]|uniref:SCP-1 and/or EzrA domain containing protein n=1 Tax=Asbolus verrucosus TaxID=1661398 RepID=A0A482WB77_ASBVE|nr:SCP-1 and/or EzrA domain containing protein [Asbolus verrucosus]